jgi:hypothetical protein
MRAVARLRPGRFQAPALLQLDEAAVAGAPPVRCLVSVERTRFRVQRLDLDAKPMLLDLPLERIELDDPAAARKLQRPLGGRWRRRFRRAPAAADSPRCSEVAASFPVIWT